MANAAKEKLVSVKLPRIPGKEERVYVSVNNRSWLIKRGVKVEIPECAYKVLCRSEEAEDIAAEYIEKLKSGE